MKVFTQPFFFVKMMENIVKISCFGKNRADKILKQVI